ncbi:hypothetical protein Plano_2922 [Planococcus sp. PAMC 21323]|nr:hypothetical protein Plano_2922 [Planococcus sp. PAMC 21323]
MGFIFGFPPKRREKNEEYSITDQNENTKRKNRHAHRL